MPHPKKILGKLDVDIVIYTSLLVGFALTLLFTQSANYYKLKESCYAQQQQHYRESQQNQYNNFSTSEKEAEEEEEEN